MLMQIFGLDESPRKRNIHFSPYLYCCILAFLLYIEQAEELAELLASRYGPAAAH